MFRSVWDRIYSDLFGIGYVQIRLGLDMFRSVWDRIRSDPFGTGYIQIRLRSDMFQIRLGSDMFRSVWDRIHFVYTGPIRNWNGTVPYAITFIIGVSSRSDPYRIYQVPCEHKAYPYQFRTGSKRIRSRVNAALNLAMTCATFGG